MRGGAGGDVQDGGGGEKVQEFVFVAPSCKQDLEEI